MSARHRDDARVVHVVPALFGPDGGIVGGAERYALELARHMASERPTSLVSFGDVERRETIGQLRVRVIGAPHYVGGHRANPVSAALIGELLGADVVHCHQQHLVSSSLAAAFCRATGRKVFVTELGGGGWDVSNHISTDRWFHGHLHISEYSRSVYGHASKPWAKVIMGGVDAEKFSPPPTGSERDGGALFVGRLLPHKGVNYLVEGLPSQMPLDLIGQPYDARFVADLRTLAESKKVRFRADCDDVALVEAYRRALCVVLPSVYRTTYGDESMVPELLGQTLLEGMACGAPGIGTRVASLPEVVDDGVTGILVPPNDAAAIGNAVAWLRDHPAKAAQMGSAARLRVLEKFTWPAVVRRCLEAYAQ